MSDGGLGGVSVELARPAASQACCGECGSVLVCRSCYSADVVAAARQALAEVIRGVGGRNSAARVIAAKLVLTKDYLEHLSDADLLFEVQRRKR